MSGGFVIKPGWRWLALLLAVLTLPLHAATYAFRSDTYAWETATTVVNWDSTCTQYQDDDDKATIAFTGGFTFTFAGTAYSSVRVLTNGMLQFGADTGLFRDYTNDQMPLAAPPTRSGCTSGTATNVIAAYWTDLNPGANGSGNVTWQQKGSAPNRYVVVSWNNVYQYGTKTPYTFQVILYESGEFKYQYGNANASGSNATIGVQVSATDYTQYSYNSGYNANGSAIRWFPANTTPARVAEYRMDELSWSGAVGEVLDSSGNSHNGTPVGAAANVAGGYICRGLDIPGNTSNTTVSAVDTAVPVASLLGAQGGISMWVKSDVVWTSNTAAMLFDASTLASRPFFLMRGGGGALKFSLTDTNGTVLSASSTNQSFAANAWVHVAATWRLNTATNGSVLRLYINGLLASVTNGSTSGNLHGSISTLFLGDNRTSGVTPSGGSPNSANGVLDEARIYNYEMTAVELAADLTNGHGCSPPLHHLELRGSATGLTCTPTTWTVLACQDAACSAFSTSGASGTLSATPTGSPTPTISWPAGSGNFSIAAGSSSTTVQMQLVKPGSVTMGAAGISPSPSSGTTCNFSACTFTAADSGLLFDVPNHVAEVAQAVSVRAVKKDDTASGACVPAFASVSKAVAFSCGYTDPSSGSLPVRVGGAAVACGGSGQNVSLSFDATGSASTTVQYADVGKLTLSAAYAGTGTDAGLSMSGTDTFIAAPYQFAVSGAAGSRIAGVGFSASVTAQNYAGNATPNFGREATPQGATLGWVRTQPQGTGAVNGSFSGALGGFSAGVATASSAAWSEVGRIDLSALLTGASYLGTGYAPAGSSAGPMVLCASESGSCAIPAGSVATVYYGANGSVYQLPARTGNVACTNAVFGDPLAGSAKQCWYVVTGGNSAASTGALGPFRPHHFTVDVTPACTTGSRFQYAGQAFGATITAWNGNAATPGITLNYDGSASTSPKFAQELTLSEAVALAAGSFGSTATVPAASFAAGAASALPVYTFTSKQTVPKTLVVRAVDADAVSSLGYTEGSLLLRSGRLRLFNAFGSEKSSLQVPLQAEYWSAGGWSLNSDDVCTSVAAAAVALSGYRDYKGAAQSGWSSTPTSTGVLVAGRGMLTLSPLTGNAAGSVELALNLGSGTDQSCGTTAPRPATTGAAAPWLRSQYCGFATWDRDPAARASFGLSPAETRKTVHAREIF